jgi:hypothetical protein
LGSPLPQFSDCSDFEDEPSVREADDALDVSIKSANILNHRRVDALGRYRDALGQANQVTDCYNKHVAAAGQLLPFYSFSPTVNTENRVAEAETRLPEAIF